jgi:hypothetical protein
MMQHRAAVSLLYHLVLLLPMAQQQQLLLAATAAPPAAGGCYFSSCGCNCTLGHTEQDCWQPNGSKTRCDCATGAGCWGPISPKHSNHLEGSKRTDPAVAIGAGPSSASGCGSNELQVCVAAHSGHGRLLPLGSICAPQCPAGFVNTSIFCPAIPAGVTEVGLDCLFHQNPLKPGDKGYNKTCPCPGPPGPTNPNGCTCLSACALEGCPSNAACGAGRVCNMRSQFHVCLFPWNAQECGASVDMMRADEFENQRRPNTIYVVID